MIKYLILFIPILGFGGEVLDYQMSPQEKKATGLFKLTEKEKAALQNWIDNHYEKRAAPLANPLAEKRSIIYENLQGGKFIKLSDNTLWQIRPQDTPITQSWITPVEIIITQSGDPDYPELLTNSLTGSSARAKRAQ